MKALYPGPHEIPKLSDSAVALKIARHSPCYLCSAEICSGLRPPSSVQLISDVEGESVSPSIGYLSSCACGHSVPDHGADSADIGRDEFARRGRVAVRLDQLLQDQGKLLDFDYSDEDIESLRRQMRIPDQDSAPQSPLSDLLGSLVPSSPEKEPLSPTSLSLDAALEGDEEPPAKRRRLTDWSESDLSSNSDSSTEDEDKQSVTEHTTYGNNSSGSKGEGGASKTSQMGRKTRKGVPSMKSKAQTAPISIPPPTEQERAEMVPPPANKTNGHESKVKVEEKMDEGQLSRLVTGVTVDAAPTSSTTPSTKPEKPALVELRKGIIRIVPIENDRQPRSLVILTGLKTLFQKQLPKMPREYIARLVFDSNSKCLAIIKRGYKVVGGICYRPFPHRGFAEIVFFATASVDQIKGYGGMLMDHFKAHIRKAYPDMMYFLTYADNYAVGYFRKQGFSKEISLDRSVWAGYIKDYEGGTIMQCSLLRKVDYTQVRDTIAKQREAILEKIREKSRSHIVYPGLDPAMWESRSSPLDPRDIPGLRESGWTPDMAAITYRGNSRSSERTNMENLLSDLQGHALAWAFLQPVNAEEVPGYYDVITNPMDFATMEHKIDTNQYASLDAFLKDAHLVFENCRTFNPEGSLYYKNANKLEAFLKQQVNALKVKKEDS